MNVAIISGRLAKDPVLRYTTSGTAVASFNVAVDNRNKDADFFDCVAWKGTAEFVQKYFKKGKSILIHGEFHNRSWTTGEGEKHSKSELTCNSVEFFSEVPKNPSKGTDVEFDEVDVDDGDLPF